MENLFLKESKTFLLSTLDQKMNKIPVIVWLILTFLTRSMNTLFQMISTNIISISALSLKSLHSLTSLHLRIFGQIISKVQFFSTISLLWLKTDQSAVVFASNQFKFVSVIKFTYNSSNWCNFHWGWPNYDRDKTNSDYE